MQDVIVIGAGISGLACAYRLKSIGRNVLVIDAGNRVGGVIESRAVDGFLFERGPNSFLETPELAELLDNLGITPYLVTADAKSPRYVYHKGKLRPVPMGLFDFLATRLLTPLGKLRSLGEMFVAKSPVREDESVEQFITRRFGKEIHDVLVGPFVSGVYAGNTAELSVRAAKPFSSLAELEAEHGSVIGSLFGRMFSGRSKSSTGEPSRRKNQSCSFLSGMETLPKALKRALINELLLNCRIRNIDFHASVQQPHYTLEVEFAGDVQPMHASAVVVAAPAYTAAKLLGPFSERLSSLLQSIPYPPLVSVALAYSESQLDGKLPKPLRGFGFLVPRGEGHRTLGSLWNSAQFPERAPDGYITLTNFIGGSTDTDVLSLTDEEIVRIVHQDLQRIMGLTGSPKVLGVTRWERAIPQYTLGFVERRQEIEKLVGRFPGLYLAGNYLHGVSVGDCIAFARQVADRTEEYLFRTGPPSTGVTPSTRTGSDLLL